MKSDAVTQIKAAVQAAYPEPVEREVLIEAATSAGLDGPRAGQCVSNLLMRGVLVRVTTDGHTLFALADGETVPDSKTTKKRVATAKRATKAKRVTTAPTRTSRVRVSKDFKVVYPPTTWGGEVTHAVIGDAAGGEEAQRFRCGVLDSGELVLFHGEEWVELTVEQTARVHATLRRWSGDA